MSFFKNLITLKGRRIILNCMTKLSITDIESSMEATLLTIENDIKALLAQEDEIDNEIKGIEEDDIINIFESYKEEIKHQKDMLKDTLKGIKTKKIELELELKKEYITSKYHQIKQGRKKLGHYNVIDLMESKLKTIKKKNRVNAKYDEYMSK